MAGLVKAQIPEKLLPLVTIPKRFKIVYGGRGSGKSTTAADIHLGGAHCHGWKVGCFREYQNSLEDSVHALLQEEILRLKAPGFSVQGTRIKHTSGGLFRFKGLSRNPGSVQSMQGFKRFWVEEGQYTTKQSLKILTPTLRAEEAELMITLNLMSSTDAVSERFIEPFKAKLDRDGYYEDDLHLIIKMNYRDNPWFPRGLEQERLWDFNNLPRALYDHIWEGEYHDEIEGSIILADWFDACIDAHDKLGFKPLGKMVVSHDPSDEGKDDKSLVVRHGSVILEATALDTGDTNDGLMWALNTGLDIGMDHFTYDSGGIGLPLKTQVKEFLKGKRISWSPFNGAERSFHPNDYYDGDSLGSEDKKRTNKQVFKNRRAQFYWMLRDLCYNTYRAVTKGEYIDPEKLISFSSDITHLAKLKSELCRIPRKYNPNGLIQIMSKPEMAGPRFKLPSPNLADSVMMSLFLGDEDDGLYEDYLPDIGGHSGGSWQSL